jgi:hypothetical protein
MGLLDNNVRRNNRAKRMGLLDINIRNNNRTKRRGLFDNNIRESTIEQNGWDYPIIAYKNQ